MSSPPRERLRPRVVLGVAGAAAMLVLLAFAASRGLAPSVTTTPNAGSTGAPERVGQEASKARASQPVALPSPEPRPSSPPSSSEPIAEPAAKTTEPLPALAPAMPRMMGRSPRAAKGVLLAAECDDPFFTDANGLRQLKPQCIDR